MVRGVEFKAGEDMKKRRLKYRTGNHLFTVVRDRMGKVSRGYLDDRDTMVTGFSYGIVNRGIAGSKYTYVFSSRKVRK